MAAERVEIYINTYLFFCLLLCSRSPAARITAFTCYVTGATTTIMTVTDPITGQPVQQVVQTIIDPNTGETSQILTNPNSNLGIVL